MPPEQVMSTEAVPSAEPEAAPSAEPAGEPAPSAEVEVAPRSEPAPLSPTRDRLAVPDLGVLMDPRVTPYHLNPVRWTYLSRQQVGDGAPNELRVHLTTTAEREIVGDGAGLALTLVTEVETRPPEGVEGEWFSGGYQARIALLDERGLTISDPNPEVGGLEAQPSDWRAVLEGSPPTWPLPGAEGCTGTPGAFRLPFGTVGGVLVDCPGFTAHIGQADVRTVWVDQVGFVYREIRVVAEQGDRVYSDYLLAADVAALAPPPPEGEVVELVP